MSNYPDGISEVNAPWNACDPWVGRECCECSRCKSVDKGEEFVCVYDIDDIVTVDPRQAACEGFEG